MHTPCKYVKLPPGKSDAFPVMMKNLSIIEAQAQISLEYDMNMNNKLPFCAAW